MKKFLNEFKEFALRGNVMDLAIGVIIGAAFKDIVTSLTDNFINPILTFIMNFGKVRYGWAAIAGFASNFITAVINFVIMAFILFLLVKLVNTLMTIGKKKEVEAPAEPTTKVCPFCKSEIAIDATRCAHCTAELDK